MPTSSVKRPLKKISLALLAALSALFIAELELSVLERLKSYADERNSLLVVGRSEETQSYNWLKSRAERSGVPFADWTPRANSVREVMPRLTLDNQHSGGHHRAWVNQIIAAEFARQIRAGR